LVTAGTAATTADIVASTDKNYVTDAQQTVLTNTSGTNTGDQTLPTLSSLGAVAANSAITGATNTKITYDSKGLVTAGTAATTADIVASTDKNYVTDAQQTVLTNTSGTNTGDQTTITGNAGTATKLAATKNINGVAFDGSGDITVTADAETLTGATLASNVLSSSLTSVGTIATGTWNGTTIAIANGGTGQTTKATAFDALSPMTTSGDIIYGGDSGTGTLLAKGTDGQVLTLAGGLPTWTSGVSTITSKTASYTLTTSDNYVIASSGTGITFTLPTAVGNTGKEFTIKNISSNNVAIATTSSQTIVVDAANSAATTAILGVEASNNWIRVISDGLKWIAFRALF